MSKKLLAVLLAGLFLLALPACSAAGRDRPDEEIPELSEPEEEPEYPVTLAGATLESRPTRVVSLSPALTEKLCDLNAEDRIVGISGYCEYPAAIADRPRCGTPLLPDLNVIAELSPHLIVSEAELPDEALEQLEQAGIAVAVVSHADSLDALMDSYRTLAMLLDGQQTGAEIGDAFAAGFQRSLNEISNAVAPHAAEGEKAVLYLRYLDYTVATGDTVEHELMSAVYLNNVAADQTQWAYADAEQDRELFAGIDVIFCDERDVTITMLEQNAFYKGLPAVLQDRYLYLDATVFELQGLRMLDLVQEMAAYCYPDADFFGSGASEPEAEDLPDDDGVAENAEDVAEQSESEEENSTGEAA